MATATGPVLVTGAGGFIGQALVRRLVAEGRTTVCTARRSVEDVVPGSDVAGSDEDVDDLRTAASWVVGDLADPGFVHDLVCRVRPAVVFHLASRVTGSRALEVVPATLVDNLVASVNVLQAVTEVGCERVVLIGSGDEPVGDEPPCSPYAATKWAVGGYARMYHALYGTPVATARPFMVYGPDRPDSARVIPYVTTSLLRGEAPRLSSGRRRCDWVHIDDVVDALLVVAGDPACVGRVTDVGTGRLETVRHVVGIVRSLVGGDVDPALDSIPDRPFETEAVADAAGTERRCGWTASIPLREGLARTVAWYADRVPRRAAPRTGAP